MNRTARRTVTRRSLILDLATRGRMPGDLTLAAGLLHQDLEARHGSSAGIVANLTAVRVDGDRRLDARSPDPAPFDRLQRILATLSPEERELLGALSRLGSTTGGKIADLGISTGYEGQAERVACLTGHIQAMMRRIESFYRHDAQTGRFFQKVEAA